VGGLAELPIVDLSGKIKEAANYHYQWFHFAVRERLRNVDGYSENFVKWRGNGTDGAVVQQKAFDFLNQWVSGMKLDRSRNSAREKLAAHRPSDFYDGCWTSVGHFYSPAPSRPDRR
jgi:hypothetical protein